MVETNPSREKDIVEFKRGERRVGSQDVARAILGLSPIPFSELHEPIPAIARGSSRAPGFIGNQSEYLEFFDPLAPPAEEPEPQRTVDSPIIGGAATEGPGIARGQDASESLGGLPEATSLEDFGRRVGSVVETIAGLATNPVDVMSEDAARTGKMTFSEMLDQMVDSLLGRQTAPARSADKSTGPGGFGRGFGGKDVGRGAVGNANDTGGFSNRGIEGMQTGFGTDEVGFGSSAGGGDGGKGGGPSGAGSEASGQSGVGSGVDGAPGGPATGGAGGRGGGNGGSGGQSEGPGNGPGSAGGAPGGAAGAGMHMGGPVSENEVPGQMAADVPKTLQEGEFVISRPAVQVFGPEFFEQLNQIAMRMQGRGGPNGQQPNAAFRSLGQ